MPRGNLNYSNTIIYKIYCKNKEIKDIFIGHTTNFSKRKYRHKKNVDNNNNTLYNIIRENGGWNNWNMIEIAKLNCRDNIEAKIKEKEYFEVLKNNNLNYIYLTDNNGIIDGKLISNIYFCNYCNLDFNNYENYEIHINNCNQNEKNFINKSKKNFPNNEDEDNNKYYCSLCNYNALNKSKLERHLTTLKHMKNSTLKKIENNNLKLNCDCGNSYKDRSGLWKHKKICEILVPKNFNKEINEDIEIDEIENEYLNILDENNLENYNNDREIIKNLNLNECKDELILMLIKQNAEILKIQQNQINQQNHIIELYKNQSLSNLTNYIPNNNIQNNNIQNLNTKNNNSIPYNNIISNNNNNYNNSNNKTFNLQFFLNETCKNAMNISDFVDSIKLQLSDLINVGEEGYIKGISKIIIKNLNALDITERPIHCTDKKREVLYVKDQGKWEKEDDEKNKLKKVIKNISFKNMRLLPQFREKFPEYKDSESLISDQYNKLVLEAMGGKGDNNNEKEDKIIKNILKATTINKDNFKY
jgi:hypothetical protein